MHKLTATRRGCSTGSPISVFVSMSEVFECGVLSFTNTTRILYSIQIVTTYRVSLFCPWLSLYRISKNVNWLKFGFHIQTLKTYWQILSLGYLWLLTFPSSSLRALWMGRKHCASPQAAQVLLINTIIYCSNGRQQISLNPVICSFYYP
jgi:hypothetical protein